MFLFVFLILLYKVCLYLNCMTKGRQLSFSKMWTWSVFPVYPRYIYPHIPMRISKTLNRSSFWSIVYKILNLYHLFIFFLHFLLFTLRLNFLLFNIKVKLDQILKFLRSWLQYSYKDLPEHTNYYKIMIKIQIWEPWRHLKTFFNRS